MLRRSTKIQLALFVIITLLGVSYVSAEYIGLTKYILDDGCTVHADFDNSGGIFTNAEVTYRGVTVGQVGSLSIVGKAIDLPKGGVRVALDLNSCTSPHIPADVSANIHNRSVVGEQYVDLVPSPGTKGGPYIAAGGTIPATRTTTPVPTENLLEHLNDLITSVPLGDLRTTVTELYAAVNGRGGDLRTLLDSTDALLKSATQSDNLAATKKLIEDSSTVLQTQLDKQSDLQSWTHSLNLLAQQLRTSDPDIRRLLDNGPDDLSIVNSFVKVNQSDIAVTLANLSTTGSLLVQHLNGLEEVLELYPALAAGGQSVVANRRAKLGLVLQVIPDPPDCGNPKKGQEGYGGTQIRDPSQLAPIAPNVAAHCSPASDVTNVRGSANVPGGDPISVSGGGYAYPRVVTDNTLNVGPTFSKNSVVNDGRYLTSLTASLG